MEHIEGLVAPPFTPMTRDGQVNLAMVPRLAKGLRQTGVCGVFVCGTTGESASLTLDERMRLAEAWKSRAGGLKVIVQVGGNCLPDSRVLAAHAQKIGADAIGAIAPSFFKPADAAVLAEHCAAIAAAAPELPFYYYHIPGVTGVAIRGRDFLAAALRRIPTLAGMKFTHEDLMDYLLCRQMARGRLDILFGRDEMLLSALAVGARGAIGTTYNFAAGLYLRLIVAFRAGRLEEARRQQVRACRMIDILLRYGVLPAGKQVMKMSGLDCGGLRLPLTDLSPRQARDLRADLERIGFFNWRGGEA